jgi:hypothetical protein
MEACNTCSLADFAIIAHQASNNPTNIAASTNHAYDGLQSPTKPLKLSTSSQTRTDAHKHPFTTPSVAVVHSPQPNFDSCVLAYVSRHVGGPPKA